MAKHMQLQTSDGWVTLGEVSSAGAEHLVRLTAAGRAAYEANRPDTILVRQDGSDLYVKASFVRNAADWRIEDDGADAPAAPAPQTRSELQPAPEPAADDDGDTDYGSWTKADLQAELDQRGIEYAARATKAELVALLDGDDDE